MKPLVSIICITFNQEKYIEQTINSLLMQETRFDFEIIIHDDASTDNTKNIIQQYSKQYPGKFKVMFEKENQFSKGNIHFVDRMFRSAKGKYIALCEGDDYWVDPKKLQIQVDFLENHPDYSICFHPVRVFFEDKKRKDYIFPDPSIKLMYTTRELLTSNFIQTNSVMYRHQAYSSLSSNILPNDLYLHLYHARFGKIGFINRVMADYRRNIGGIWWETDGDVVNFWTKNWESQLKFYQKILDLFQDSNESIEIINKSIANIFGKLVDIDKRNNKRLLNEAIKKYPQYTAIAIISTLTQLHEHEQLYNEKEKQRLIGLLDKKDKELEAIKSSKFWKLRNVYSKLLNREEIK